MKVKRYIWWGIRCVAAAVVLFVAAYAAYVGVTWYRYGDVQHTQEAESTDVLLDSFIPVYDVARLQHVRAAGYFRKGAYPWQGQTTSVFRGT
jgi:hypothetical protein